MSTVIRYKAGILCERALLALLRLGVVGLLVMSGRGGGVLVIYKYDFFLVTRDDDPINQSTPI